MKILYVCTGNICRSPLAEAITRHEAKIRGLSFLKTASAGTHAYHVGEPPDHRSVAVATRRGISTAGQKARKISLQDFENYDLILAMDRTHLDHLHQICPAASSHKVKLFMVEACGRIEDVPDPYYGQMKDFEDVFVMIERGVKGLLDTKV